MTISTASSPTRSRGSGYWHDDVLPLEGGGDSRVFARRAGVDVYCSETTPTRAALRASLASPLKGEDASYAPNTRSKIVSTCFR
jgi:hypothetical protein